MKEKMNLSLEAHDLLEQYGLTEFHLDLVTYFNEESCNRAKLFLKAEWAFCPTCGGERRIDGTIEHLSPLWDTH